MKRTTRLWLCWLTATVGLWAQAAEDLRVSMGKSLVIDYPADIGRISTSNPETVDAVAVTSREILLHAKNYGTATVVVWSKAGQRAFYNITVEQNLEPIRKLLRETFPTEDIRVQASRDSLSLTGQVSAQGIADRAVALVAPMAKSVVNNLQVAIASTEKQVLLRVKFAELNRNASSSFGVNLVSMGALNTPGSISTGQFSPPRLDSIGGGIPPGLTGSRSTFTITDALNIFAFRPDLNIAGFVKALQSQGLLQILAEPNLVTTNGKEAHFLVGGEFPIPVLQGGSNAGAVTIVFKEFGIRLTFLPTVTENGTVRMYVRPEVSTIDLSNAVTFSGFVIPALSSRRMETNIELGLGQSFVIAGLMDERMTESLNKIPGLSHIPLLGALFKSRSENKANTELIVMVTPEVTKPLEATDPKPIPIMPKEFLTPITPEPGKVPKVSETGNSAPKEKRS
jgi:pilus assembly protein CpaC